MKYYGALEAGGTKMVLSVGNEANEILEQAVIPTESPINRLTDMCKAVYLLRWHKKWH